MNSLFKGLVAATMVMLVLPVAVASADETDHLIQEHRTVRIGAGRIRPQSVKLGEDEALAWLNYSSLRARISFDRAVSAKLHCDSPADFRLQGDRLVSPEIRGPASHRSVGSSQARMSTWSS